MIKVTFTKPPRFTLVTYFIGFIFIGFTVTHQVLQLTLISHLLNQQLLIGGAIIIAIGSIFSWVYPYFKSDKENPDSPSDNSESET